MNSRVNTGENSTNFGNRLTKLVSKLKAMMIKKQITEASKLIDYMASRMYILIATLVKFHSTCDICMLMTQPTLF